MAYALFPILLLAVFAVHAAPFKWTDERGQVHYSDQPPTESARNLQSLSSDETITVVETDSNVPAGLRPSEIEALKAMERHEQRKAAAPDYDLDMTVVPPPEGEYGEPDCSGVQGPVVSPELPRSQQMEAERRRRFGCDEY